MQIVTNLSALCFEILSCMRDLAGAMDISPTYLSQNEHLAECVLSSFCSGDEFVERFTYERVTAWYRALGTDLTIQFDTPEGQLVVSQLNYEDGLDKLHRMVEEIEVDRVSIDITVRKEDLRTRIAAYIGVPIDALFLFEETLLDRLTLDGVQVLLDHKVLSRERHTIVGILSGTGLLTSTYLTVVGLSDALSADFLQLRSPAYSERKWCHVQMLRDTIALWATPLKEIAPDMFVMEQQRQGLEKIHRALAGICDVLSILQFCVSVNSYDSKIWRATPTYPSSRIIDVASNVPYRDPSDSLTGLAPAAYRLYRWAFSAENYDKINVVRDLLQRDIADSQADLLDRLIEAAPQLLESARANYKILRHKAFEAYLRSRQEAKRRSQPLPSQLEKACRTYEPICCSEYFNSLLAW
jgi:hypothetical protein